VKLPSPIVALVAVAVLVGCCHVGAARSTQAKLPHSMKGYELYSWQARGGWYFAVLIGTNRLKTRREVRAPGARVKGVEALKRKLDLLTEGEEVSWGAGLVPGTVLPPESIVQEIKGHCDRRGIILRVNRGEGGDASNNGMHPTADTTAFKFLQTLGAAGDAGRYAASPELEGYETHLTSLVPCGRLCTRFRQVPAKSRTSDACWYRSAC